MTCRLVQYQIVEAAVRDSFLPWVEAHGCDAFGGVTPVVVADHAYQLASLKSRVLAAGISAMGVEWQTAAGLRRYLCHQLGVRFEPLGRENLELILRVAAQKLAGNLALALRADPSDALRAMDELGRAGHLPRDWEKVLAPEFSELGRVLESSGGWLPVLEQQCLQAAASQEDKIGPVMIFGWGGQHFPDLRLISALPQMGSDLTVVVPMPRLLGGEDLDATWIETLEAQLGVESEFASHPEDWQGRHDAFISSLVLETPSETGKVPEVLVGHSIADQAVLVADWVERLSQDEQLEISATAPVGCLVTGEGGSLYQLTREFSRRGLVYHQETGEVLAAGGFHTFHKLLVRCFSTQSDVDEVLRLFEWLLAREEPCVAGLEYQRLRDLCRRQFNRCQRRCFADLWTGGVAEEQKQEEQDGRHARHYEALRQFAVWLQPWPEQLSWGEARERWVQVATVLGFGADYLEPVWSRLTEVLADQAMPSRYFFEYLESLLAAPGLWREPTAVNPYARIIVTTQEAAVGRSWGALVLMDSQEGVWPVPVRDNPFLKDTQRDRLNQKIRPGQSRLLTGRDRTQLRHQMILGLMENCRGEVLFTGSLTDGRAPEVKTFPNEWAAQVLLAASSDPETALDSWDQAVKTKQVATVDQLEDDLLQFDKIVFQQVHASRAEVDPSSDEWDFRFSRDESAELSSLNASRLDAMLSKPASCALDQIFKSVPRDAGDFDRQEALLLGIWTHDELAKILTAGQGAAVGDILADRGLVPTEFPGLWMRVLSEKAAWMVRACLHELQNLEGCWQVDRVEWTAVPVTCETPAGPLKLAGRLDLILKSDAGELLIIDFKTGSSAEIPTPNKLKAKGEGLQYIAYLLLAGGDESKVRVVSPFGAPDRELSGQHLEEAQEHLAALARMAHLRIYPRRGALRDEFGFKAEVLPLTTLEVDADTLEARWIKFHQQEVSQ